MWAGKGKLLGIGWFDFSADAWQTLTQGDALWVAAVLGHHVRREQDHQGASLGFEAWDAFVEDRGFCGR